ncbi:MAG: ferredoxin [Acidimicrobiia bacterium]|jgi:ferredoxin|nr:ferredoxin [Acidimicrobiia bacterium]
MRVWIDQDLCTGDGLCTDHCPELFVLLEDGISYVHLDGRLGNDPGGSGSDVWVPARLEEAAIASALDCPGECIFLEDDGDD